MEEHRKSNFFYYILTALKGICMGFCDIIPGVSGGTIAFITGIYDTLLQSINAVGKNIKLLFKFKIAAFYKAINGNFLLALILGIGISIFSLSHLMVYLLDFHPIPTWSFFFGLILISTVFVLKDIKKFSLSAVFCFIFGSILGFYITIATPSQTPDSLFFIFLCGAIAVCAMILPGISGSFILLLLGKYDYILASLNSLNIIVLAVFALGAIIGLLSFSKVLHWLLSKYKNATIATLAGFMLGSLNKIWPWKILIDPNSNQISSWSLKHSPDLIEKNILPTSTENPQILIAIASAAAAILICSLIQMLASKRKINK